MGIFAYAIQSLSSTERVEHYADYLKWITPVLVIAYGAYLLFKTLKHRKTESGCSCGHNHNSNDNISNARTASITGFIAGLMPCPTAIAPLVIAGVHNDFSHTLSHVLIYVCGMTLALLSFTGILLLLKSLFNKQVKLAESKINFSLLSALIMIGIGVVYLGINVLSSNAHLHF